MIRKFLDKISGNGLYNEAIKFCFENKNPSVWALQEVFGLDYLAACRLRTRLVNDGYVELFEKKIKKTDIVIINLSERIA